MADIFKTEIVLNFSSAGKRKAGTIFQFRFKNHYFYIAITARQLHAQSPSSSHTHVTSPSHFTEQHAMHM